MKVLQGSLNMLLNQKEDLWFATKDTISKESMTIHLKYLCEEIYNAEYKEKFEAGITYFYAAYRRCRGE